MCGGRVSKQTRKFRRWTLEVGEWVDKTMSAFFLFNVFGNDA